MAMEVMEVAKKEMARVMEGMTNGKKILRISVLAMPTVQHAVL